MRTIGNVLLLVGQGFILYHHVGFGIILKLLGCGIICREFLKTKDYDFVIVMAAFATLDASKLLSILLNR